MKNTSKTFSIVVAVLLCTVACTKSASTDDDDQSTTQYFSSADEAVAKAKADLLAVLETDKSINLGIETASLQNAQPGKAIVHAVVDFNRLTTLDSLADFSKIVAENSNTLVPLVNQGNVVTVVEINQDSKGWKVAGLGHAAFTNQINAVAAQFQNAGDVEVQLYEVPNLDAYIYVVRAQGAQHYFTDYQGSSLRERVNPTEIVARLKADAEIFIKNYGDQLKGGKLVK